MFISLCAESALIPKTFETEWYAECQQKVHHVCSSDWWQMLASPAKSHAGSQRGPTSANVLNISMALPMTAYADFSSAVASLLKYA